MANKILPGQGMDAGSFLAEPNGQADFGIRTLPSGRINPSFLGNRIDFKTTDSVEKGQLVYLTGDGIKEMRKSIRVDLGDFQSSAWAGSNLLNFFEKTDGGIVVVARSASDIKSVVFATLNKNIQTGIYVINNTSKKSISPGYTLQAPLKYSQAYDHKYFGFVKNNYSNPARIEFTCMVYDDQVLSTESLSSDIVSIGVFNKTTLLFRTASGGQNIISKFKIKENSHYLSSQISTIPHPMDFYDLNGTHQSQGMWFNSTNIPAEIVVLNNGICAMCVGAYSSGSLSVSVALFHHDESTNLIKWSRGFYDGSSLNPIAVKLVQKEGEIYLIKANEPNIHIVKISCSLDAAKNITFSSTLSGGVCTFGNNLFATIRSTWTNKLFVSSSELVIRDNEVIYYHPNVSFRLEKRDQGWYMENKTTPNLIVSNSFTQMSNGIISFAPKGIFLGFVEQNKQAGDFATAVLGGLLDLFNNLEIGSFYRINNYGSLEKTTTSYTGEKFLAISNTTLIGK